MTAVELVLGRRERPVDVGAALRMLRGRTVLISGGAGSVGLALADLLEPFCDVYPSDVEILDVRDAGQCRAAADALKPDVVFHLAGAKHAPAGEDDPVEALMVNAQGTANMLAAFGGRARMVTASTCKACNPETAYGASKLLAERMTLNAGQTVARFHNIVETQGNVFELWRDLPPYAVVPVTPCSRFFVSIGEAVSLLVAAAVEDPGRYMIHPGEARRMSDVAASLYPTRCLSTVAARRGDRITEPLHGTHETMTHLGGGLTRVVSPHDGRFAGVGVAETASELVA